MDVLRSDPRADNHPVGNRCSDATHVINIGWVSGGVSGDADRICPATPGGARLFDQTDRGCDGMSGMLLLYVRKYQDPSGLQVGPATQKLAGAGLVCTFITNMSVDVSFHSNEIELCGYSDAERLQLSAREKVH